MRIPNATILSHPSFNQVALDVNRCNSRLEHIRQLETENKDVCRHIVRGRSRNFKRMVKLFIVRILVENPSLHYYQGFHDVCLTYICLYGREIAHEELSKKLVSHFGLYMQPTMNETQKFLDLILYIVHDCDPELGIFLVRSEERDPHMVLYLCAALVLDKSKEIKQLEPEMSVVHRYLSSLPTVDRMLLDLWLLRAEWLYLDHPPGAMIMKQRYPITVPEQMTVNHHKPGTMANTIRSIAAMNPMGRKTTLAVIVLISAFAWTLRR